MRQINTLSVLLSLSESWLCEAASLRQTARQLTNSTGIECYAAGLEVAAKRLADVVACAQRSTTLH